MVIKKPDLKKITDYLWEIPQGFRPNMRVPARIYSTEDMLKEVLEDRSVNQIINVSTLPGIQRAALAMPDVHQGYGFPIGGVAAIEYPDGVISPGGIGYDINCGVRLLKSGLSLTEIQPQLRTLAQKFFQNIPAGVGRGGQLKLGRKELDFVLAKGIRWMLEQEYANQNDLENVESMGSMDDANPNAVSEQAKKRGSNQLGTLGAGNHFVEIGLVSEIFDEKTASAFGLFEDQITVLVHTGSRGLGHQVATDYIRTMTKAMPKYRISVPDPQLVCVPFSSPEGSAYFAAMSAAANYAWANRQMITWLIRKVWEETFGSINGKLPILYDVAHNIAKIEEHEINNQKMQVIVHRKGATRAFGPGHPDLTKKYQLTGQPLIIPGSMGTASYVLVGTQKAMQQSFGSSCHGAGRRMSRTAAKKQIQGYALKENLEKKGVHILTGQVKSLGEEAPQAYKDVDKVVEIVHQAEIAKKVARLKPLVVIKG